MFRFLSDLAGPAWKIKNERDLEPGMERGKAWAEERRGDRAVKLRRLMG